MKVILRKAWTPMSFENLEENYVRTYIHSYVYNLHWCIKLFKYFRSYPV